MFFTFPGSRSIWMFFTFPGSLKEGVFLCSSHSLDPWRREYLNVLHIPWIPAGGSILMFFTFPESLEEGVFECSSHSLDPWRREYWDVLHIPWIQEYLDVLHIPWIPAGGSIWMFFTLPWIPRREDTSCSQEVSCLLSLYKLHGGQSIRTKIYFTKAWFTFFAVIIQQ